MTAEGNLGSSPILTETSSPLPGLTPMAPVRDLPSAVLDGKGGRQPTDYDSHDESARNGDSQNLIAPPVTFLEGDTVIYSACTTLESSRMRETPTKIVSVTQSPSPSVNLVMSETPTDTSK